MTYDTDTYRPYTRGEEDPGPSDEDLMGRVGSGDESALRELMRRHGPPLVRYFVLKLRDEGHAQDLANETFYRIFLKARTFDSERRFAPWLYAVAANVGRAWKSRRSSRELPLDRTAEPVRSHAGSEAASAGALLGRLSEVDREILRLRHYDGMKLKDIARRLGLSQANVYTRLFRALRKLRESTGGAESM